MTSPDIFISYSSEDREWVSRFAKSLENKGYDVWWDITILPGQDFRSAIQEALENAKCVTTIWSKSSITSPWVQAETYTAFEQKKLIPILYQDVKIPLPFNSVQTANMINWDFDIEKPNFQKLLLGISSYINNEVRSLGSKSTFTEIPPDEWDYSDNIPLKKWFKKVTSRDNK